MTCRAPYSPAPRNFHGGYIARSTRYPCGAVRPHRNAAGMQYTASRGGGPLHDEPRALAVFGTLDPLRRRSNLTERAPCPCCGSKAAGKLRLTEAGRLRLRAARRRAGRPGE